MKRPLPLVLIAACLIGACSTTPTTVKQSETHALVSDILRANQSKLTCPAREVPYCSVNGTRIATAKEIGKGCECVPADWWQRAGSY